MPYYRDPYTLNTKPSEPPTCVSLAPPAKADSHIEPATLKGLGFKVILGFWVIVVLVQVLGKYMILRYLDP